MTVNIIDIVLIALFVIMIIEGYVRGFLVSLIGILRFFLAVPVSYFASTRLAAPVYENWVRGYIINRITIGIENAGGIDGFVEKAVDGSNPVLSAVSKRFGELSLASLSPDKAAQLITDNLIQNAAMTVLKIAIFLATLVAFYVITAIIIRIVKVRSKKDEDKPLKKANRALGAVFGALKGLVVIFVFCLFASVIISLNFADNSSFVNALEESSVVHYVIYENPISNFPEV